MASDIVSQTYLDDMAAAGAEKSQCKIISLEKSTFACEAGRISLMRTARDSGVHLTVIKGGKLGSISVSSVGAENSKILASRVITAAESSPADDAYDIAEFQKPRSFDNGIAAPDIDAMYERLSELGAEIERRHPEIYLAEASIEFVREETCLRNTNGVDYRGIFGKYIVNAEIGDKKDAKKRVSNTIPIVLKNMGVPILNSGCFEPLFSQVIGQAGAKPLEGKFVGDIIVSPDGLAEFVKFFSILTLRDAMLVAGTSVYKDKLGKQISDNGFSLRSAPASGEMADGYFLTPDGYKAEDLMVIDKGILKSFILSKYGAKKTGLPYLANNGGCFSVEPGEISFENLVKNIKRGILVGKFCEDRPNEAGDISGTIKNSLYIEDGKVEFPVSEAMISGNIPKMLMKINGISKERVNFGSAVYPWISFGGVTVSGK